MNHFEKIKETNHHWIISSDTGIILSIICILYFQILSSVNLAILKAAKFIAHDAPASIGNLYELAISFYALSLVDHSKKDELLIDLENKAKTDGNVLLV